MQRNRLLRVVFISIFLAVSLIAQAMDFQDGEYEIVVRQGVKGLPGGMGKLKWRECLTKDKPIPTQYLQANSCDVLELKTVYHTLHYKMSCFNENGTIVNAGRIYLGNTQLSGKSKSEAGGVPGESIMVRYKFRGRRIGNCP